MREMVHHAVKLTDSLTQFLIWMTRTFTTVVPRMSGEASGSLESSRLFCDRLKVPARISVSKPGTNEAELGLHPNRRNNDFLPDQSSEVLVLYQKRPQKRS